MDRAHFAAARGVLPDPEDQAHLARPRLGYYGVIDERMDLDLVAALADARPEWSVVMFGPVVKIDEADLPRRPNLHYLGGKSYAELPAYLSSWDVALMPFAINEATRFISPTKTPEYLAAGRPVVSTPVTDVVRHYGELSAVAIAGDAASFVAACERALNLASDSDGAWMAEADAVLANMDWDSAVSGMWSLVDERLRRGPPKLGVVSPDGLADRIHAMT